MTTRFWTTQDGLLFVLAERLFSRDAKRIAQLLDNESVDRVKFLLEAEDARLSRILLVGVEFISQSYKYLARDFNFLELRNHLNNYLHALDSDQQNAIFRDVVNASADYAQAREVAENIYLDCYRPLPLIDPSSNDSLTDPAGVIQIRSQPDSTKKLDSSPSTDPAIKAHHRLILPCTEPLDEVRSSVDAVPSLVVEKGGPSSILSSHPVDDDHLSKEQHDSRDDPEYPFARSRNEVGIPIIFTADSRETGLDATLSETISSGCRAQSISGQTEGETLGTSPMSAQRDPESNTAPNPDDANTTPTRTNQLYGIEVACNPPQGQRKRNRKTKSKTELDLQNNLRKRRAVGGGRKRGSNDLERRTTGSDCSKSSGIRAGKPASKRRASVKAMRAISGQSHQVGDTSSQAEECHSDFLDSPPSQRAHAIEQPAPFQIPVSESIIACTEFTESCVPGRHEIEEADYQQRHLTQMKRSGRGATPLPTSHTRGSEGPCASQPGAESVLVRSDSMAKLHGREPRTIQDPRADLWDRAEGLQCVPGVPLSRIDDFLSSRLANEPLKKVAFLIEGLRHNIHRYDLVIELMHQVASQYSQGACNTPVGNDKMTLIWNMFSDRIMHDEQPKAWIGILKEFQSVVQSR